MVASIRKSFMQVIFELLGIGKDAGLPEIQEELEEKKLADAVLFGLNFDADKKTDRRRLGNGDKQMPPEKAPEPAPKTAPSLPPEQPPVQKLKVAAPSIVAEGTTIIGEIRCSSGIEVQGNVEGNIESADDVLISGSVTGNVTGTNITLRSCKVKGNIIAKTSIEIDGGTVIVGDLSAERVVADGKIKGNITAQKTAKLSSGTYLLGDLKAGSIEIVQGASISGTMAVLSSDCADTTAFDSL